MSDMEIRAQHSLGRKPGAIRRSLRQIAAHAAILRTLAGNRNASCHARLKFRRVSLRGDSGSGKLLIDFFVHAGAAEFAGDAYGIFNGVGIRAAVRNDGDAANTKSGAPPVSEESCACGNHRTLAWTEVAICDFSELLMAFFSMPWTCSTRPSLILRATLPMKPSQTMTSTFRETHRALPHCDEVERGLFQQIDASRVNSLPFISSSPMEAKLHGGVDAPDRAEINFAHYGELPDLFG